MKLEDLAAVMAVSLHSEPAICSELIDVSMLQLSEKIDVDPITKEEIKEEQMSDEMLGPVYRCVEEKKKATAEQWKELDTKSKLVMKQFNKLKIEDGMLMRMTKKRKQLVLPGKFHDLVFQELHCKLGHLGAEKVEELARQRFYWPYLREDIEGFIRQRCRCVSSKKPNIPERAPLTPILSSAPFEMLCIDFLHLDKSQGCEYVLMVTDHFTKFTQSYGTKDKSSISAAQKLFYEFIPKFGMPERIHHDRGQEFNSSLFKELHRLSGIKASNTTPYHPMGNGQVERMNRSLLNMLKALPEKQKSKWKDHLPNLMFAYNSTVHKSTGFSPFYLVFGREPRLPIDCILPIAPNKTNRKSYDKFVKEWKQSMRDAYQIVQQNIEKAGKANKKRYDGKAKSVQIAVGDKVLVRNTEKGGTGKLRSWWEQKIYKVTEIQELVPVYTIRPLDGKQTKTVHRNMLMKVNNMPDNIFGQQPEKQEVVKKHKVLKKRRTVKTITADSSEDSDDLVIEKRTILLSTSERLVTSREAISEDETVDDPAAVNERRGDPLQDVLRVGENQGAANPVLDQEDAIPVIVGGNPERAEFQHEFDDERIIPHEDVPEELLQQSDSETDENEVPENFGGNEPVAEQQQPEPVVDDTLILGPTLGLQSADGTDSESDYDDDIVSDEALAKHDDAENSSDDEDLRTQQNQWHSSSACTSDNIDGEGFENESSAVQSDVGMMVKENESGISDETLATCVNGTIESNDNLPGCSYQYLQCDESEWSEIEDTYADDEKSEAEYSGCEADENFAGASILKSGEGKHEGIAGKESSPDNILHEDSDDNVTLLATSSSGGEEFEDTTAQVNQANPESSDTASEYLSAVEAMADSDNGTAEAEAAKLVEDMKKIRRSSRKRNSKMVTTYSKLGEPTITRYSLLGIHIY